MRTKCVKTGGKDKMVKHDIGRVHDQKIPLLLHTKLNFQVTYLLII